MLVQLEPQASPANVAEVLKRDLPECDKSVPAAIKLGNSLGWARNCRAVKREAEEDWGKKAVGARAAMELMAGSRRFRLPCPLTEATCTL